MEFKITAELLYQGTDRGLDILKRYCPEAFSGGHINKKKFRLRDEDRTPSSCVVDVGKIIGIKDFGSGEFFNPISFYMHLTGKDFKTALYDLAEEFNISAGNPIFANNKEFKSKGDLPNDYFKIVPKGKVENSKVINEFVTEEICKSYNVYEVERIEKVTSTGKLMITHSTEHYPIFAYSPNLEEWAKIYAPAEKKRTETRVTKTDEEGIPLEIDEKVINFKHQYLGKKPKFYLHGLERLKKEVENRKKHYEEVKQDYQLERCTEETLEKAEGNKKVPIIFIMSGGSDGLTMAGIDTSSYFPVWTNSEGDRIPYEIYKELKEYGHKIINVPDVDTSGIKYAHEYSKMYWKLETMFLPQNKMNGGKDFRDFVGGFGKDKESVKKTIDNLVKVCVSCDFVRTKKGASGSETYSVDRDNLYYFLSVNGFYVYASEFEKGRSNENKGVMVKIDGYKVKMVESSDVRTFCIDFLKNKGTNKNVINMLQKCNDFKPTELSNATKKRFNFEKYSKDFQLFYFENTCVKVSAESIVSVSSNLNKNFIMEENINKNSCVINTKEKFFEIERKEAGEKKYCKVNISETANCDFMNFLINGSRVHWKEEEAKDKDFRKHMWLDNPVLTSEQILDHYQHFANKVFSIGYLCHKYIFSDFQKFVYIMDYEMIGSVYSSNGGTGKSLFTKAISKIANVFDISGRDKENLKDKHLFGGLTENHDVICFNDLGQIDFSNYFNLVTDNITINPKNSSQKVIPYDKAPKIVGTFNFAFKDEDGSSARRLFYVAFSDYYHAKTDDREGWQPRQDFGKRFFDDWDVKDWNTFYNFIFRCVQFYLQNTDNPIEAPQGKIKENNIRITLGDNFLEWADEYFSDDFPFETDCIFKEAIYEDYKNVVGKNSVAIGKFKRNIENYCTLKGYIFNPPSEQGYQADRKRIMRYVAEGLGQSAKQKEVFVFRKKGGEKKDKKEENGVPF